MLKARCMTRPTLAFPMVLFSLAVLSGGCASYRAIGLAPASDCAADLMSHGYLPEGANDPVGPPRACASTTPPRRSPPPRVSSDACTVAYDPAAAPAGSAAKSGSKDVLETLAADGEFTTLLKLINDAELAGLLKSAGPFTVLAPTDEAFAKVPAGRMAAILSKKGIPQGTAAAAPHQWQGIDHRCAGELITQGQRAPEAADHRRRHPLPAQQSR
jgi:Fasciclin domain